MSDTDQATEAAPVRIAAVGDILLTPRLDGAADGAEPRELFEPVRPTLTGCDVVLGNLECTLPGSGETLPVEPRVVATPALVRSISRGGFNVVSLANNHTFDCLQDGFREVAALLDELQVAWFGAGDDLEAAAAPAILTVGGQRLAFLGAADERSGAARFAARGQWGIAPLDVDRLAGQIRELTGQVDHVILSLHWGEERMLIPSPGQVRQARQLAEAGAAMILGHHPHVLQGMETHAGVPIVYSLGSFVAGEVPCSDGTHITWNRIERTGCIFLAELTGTDVAGVRRVATVHAGRQVEIDRTGIGRRRLARADRAIARGVTIRRYRRQHLWVKTIKPAVGYLRWSRLRRLRWRQIRNAFGRARQARRAE